MANIGFVALHKSLRKRIQLVEVIAGVSDLERLEAKPLDHLLDGYKVLLLFLLRVRVIVAQVAFPTMEPRKAEVDGDGLAVADV